MADQQYDDYDVDVDEGGEFAEGPGAGALPFAPSVDNAQVDELFGGQPEPEPQPEPTPQPLEEFLEQPAVQGAIWHMIQEQSRIENEAGALADEHPELAEQEHAEALINDARRLAEALGQPELADEPAFWRRVYDARATTPEWQAEQHERRQEALRQQIYGDPTELGRRALPF